MSTKRDAEQLTQSGDLSLAFAEYLAAEWLELAQGVLGGDPPEDDDDLSECMTTVILQAEDDWTNIPGSFRDGIPWGDASAAYLGSGRHAYSGHAICSDWHILIVFQESDTVPGAFTSWFQPR